MTPFPIRDDSTHAPPTVVVREARLSPHGRATNPPSRTGGISAASEGVASLGLIGSLTRLGSVAVNQADPRTNSPDSSRDGFDASRRQLAADVIVRSIFYSSASLNGGCFCENPTRTDSDQLPSVFCLVRFQSPHVVNNDIGLIRNVGQAFQGENRV